jgi:hypothetical protein
MNKSPGHWIVLAGLLAALSGCSLPRNAILTSTCRPENIYAPHPQLPADLRRVVVLPTAADTHHAERLEGRDTLEPVLVTELIKTRLFEVVCADPAEVIGRTGERDWASTEALPANFFTSMRDAYDCEAVLFAELTVFRPYPPIAVGWRLKLVDARTLQILWAGDEVFDAGKVAVREAARRYALREQRSRKGADGWAAGKSPRLFGQYATASLLDTLPKR